jgi:hypothetical protein
VILTPQRVTTPACRTIDREINEALTRVTEIVAPPEDDRLGSEDE